MSAAPSNILVAALEERWQQYRARQAECRQECSEELVHDLRVAARRLLAVLDIARAIDPGADVRKLRRTIKRQLDGLDGLRDAQVMLELLAQAQPQVPELAVMLPFLQKREKSLLRDTPKQLGGGHGLVKRFESVRTAMEAQSGPEFDVAVLRAVDGAFERVQEAYGQLYAQDPVSLHHLRIRFKKFRYMAEVVRALLPAPPEQLFKRMHDYQGAMGDIHDTSNFLAVLDEFTAEGAYLLDARPIRRHFEKRLAELTAAFGKEKRKLNRFWRPSSDAPFPWEKKPAKADAS